jgi:hypothetical protein
MPRRRVSHGLGRLPDGTLISGFGYVGSGRFYCGDKNRQSESRPQASTWFIKWLHLGVTLTATLRPIEATVPSPDD